MIWKQEIKGIVHFEINFWYVLGYVSSRVFVSTVFSILIFLGQTVLVCQKYCGHLQRHLPKFLDALEVN